MIGFASSIRRGRWRIRATIKSRTRSDGYDIDIVAELILPSQTPPGLILDLLFEAISGPPGSQYYGKVERQTRCVTVHYADGMHLDITPTILFDASDPRQSWLFHAKAHWAKRGRDLAYRRLKVGMVSRGFTRRHIIPTTSVIAIRAW